MFSEVQEKKIKTFASICKLTNHCFNKCIEFPSNSPEKDLSTQEIKCLKSCTETTIKLREFFEQQLHQDYYSVKVKNQKILNEQT
jgi:hypothetical protein